MICRGCKHRKKCKKLKDWDDVRCWRYEKKTRSNTQILIEDNDALWGEIVKLKAGGRCEYCGKDGLDPHHIFTRTLWGVRWYVPNGVFLCKGHHRFFAHVDYEGFRSWIRKYRDFDDLEMRKHNTPDKMMVNIELKRELEELKKGG